MAVHADFAVAVEVIQQNIVACQLVVIGGYLLTIHRQFDLAIAGGRALRIAEVAKHLIVRAVLFDDVAEVPKQPDEDFACNIFICNELPWIV